jgi:hypothetical protein
MASKNSGWDGCWQVTGTAKSQAEGKKAAHSLIGEKCVAELLCEFTALP